MEVYYNLDDYIDAVGKITDDAFTGKLFDRDNKKIYFNGTIDNFDIEKISKFKFKDGDADNLYFNGMLYNGIFSDYIFTGIIYDPLEKETKEGTFNLDGELECSNGKIKYSNGDTDEGKFVKDILVEGVFTSLEKKYQYIGYFKDNAFWKGEIEQDGKIVFEGEMIGETNKEQVYNGKLMGLNDSKRIKEWTGKIVNGQFEGTLYFKKYNIKKIGKFHDLLRLKEGRWEISNKLMKGKFNEKGKLEGENCMFLYEEGFYKEGKFIDGELVNGKLVMNNIVVYDGTFNKKMPKKGKSNKLKLGSFLFTGDFDDNLFNGEIIGKCGRKNGKFYYNSQKKQVYALLNA